MDVWDSVEHRFQPKHPVSASLLEVLEALRCGESRFAIRFQAAFGAFVGQICLFHDGGGGLECPRVPNEASIASAPSVGPGIKHGYETLWNG